MAGSYTLPQVQVFQTFKMAQNDATRNLNPFVIGPRFYALDYADKTVREDCTHGKYTGSVLPLAWSTKMPEGAGTADKNKYSVTLEDTYVQIGASVVSCTPSSVSTSEMEGAPTDVTGDSKASKFTFASIPAGLVEGDTMEYDIDAGEVGTVNVTGIAGNVVTFNKAIDVTANDGGYDPIDFRLSTSRKFAFTALPPDLTSGMYLRHGSAASSVFAKVLSIDDGTLTVTLDKDIPVVVSGSTPSTSSFTMAMFSGVVELDSHYAELNGDTGVQVKSGAKDRYSDGHTILQATAYLNQRALRTDSANIIGNISSEEEIIGQCGKIVPSNPLAYALHCVLRNCANATIRYMAVEEDTVEGWKTALDHATNTNEVYALCPITEATDDETTGKYTKTGIIDEVERHCNEMSQPDKKSWRIAFVSSIPNKGSTASERAAAIAEESKRLANSRVYNVFPGSLMDVNGYTVDGMYAAAAVCGLSCSVLPQQPITNVEVEGFLDIPATYSEFSRTDLNDIAGGGTLIVMQDRSGGVIYVRHQISTAYSKGEGVATAELSMVRNLDSISYYFANRFAPYIGRYNITPDLLAELKAVLHDGLSYLKTATEGNRLIGPQVLDEGTEIKNIYQHPQEQDHVIANVSLNLPKPFNNFDLYLSVI